MGRQKEQDKLFYPGELDGAGTGLRARQPLADVLGSGERDP